MIQYTEEQLQAALMAEQNKATVTNKQQGYVYYPVNDYTNK